MNLFRIHIRPRGGTDDMVATFQYCMDQRILGVGWRVEGLPNTDDWSVYENAAKHVHDSLQQPRYIYENVQKGDLAWTRDPYGQYYLARVIGGWEYLATSKSLEMDIDIANVFRCNFLPVDLDAVPGTVVSKFGFRGRSIQRIHNPGALAYSQHVWNKEADERVYEVNVDDFPDIFSMLDSEETEDLVFLYLQSQGWYVVPNSRKGNTLRFEFMLAHSETGEKALTQVKTGDVRLNVDSYAKAPQRIFLFQSNEYYDGQGTENVRCISRRSLSDFLRERRHVLPESFRAKLELVGD